MGVKFELWLVFEKQQIPNNHALIHEKHNFSLSNDYRFLVDTLSFFYKGRLIGDGNMRLVEISKFIGMETSLIDKLRDGGNLLISQALSLRDNNICITCT